MTAGAGGPDAQMSQAFGRYSVVDDAASRITAASADTRHRALRPRRQPECRSLRSG